VPTLNNWSNIHLVFATDRRPYSSLVCSRHKRLCPSFLDVHYKQPWLCSTNHPPRTPQTVLFRWTLSSHHGPHSERRYLSFLRMHHNQLSLQCNHQPSTFKRRSSWSSSLCTLSSHPSNQFKLLLKSRSSLFIQHQPSTPSTPSWSSFILSSHHMVRYYH